MQIAERYLGQPVKRAVLGGDWQELSVLCDFLGAMY